MKIERLVTYLGSSRYLGQLQSLPFLESPHFVRQQELHPILQQMTIVQSQQTAEHGNPLMQKTQVTSSNVFHLYPFVPSIVSPLQHILLSSQ
jgi:hypothetical protein